MKNTTLTTKKGLVAYLEENVVRVTEEMAKQIEAVLKLGKKATLDELKELAQEVAVDLLTGGTNSPVEAEVKPAKKISKKKAPKADSLEQKAKDGEVVDLHEVAKAMKEEKPVTKEETPEPKTTKKGNKTDKPASKEEKSPVETLEAKSKKEPVLAKQFAKELETSVGKLVLNQSIATMADLYTAYEKGQNNFLAVYWNKRQLKQFDYDPLMVNKKKPTSLPQDLDLVQPIFISEDGKVLYAVSVYTEVLYALLPSDLEVDEDTGLRYINGAEYCFYTLTE